MDEEAWLASTDPAAMLAHLGGAASRRKLRLLLAARCRQADGDSPWLLDAAERFADGEIGLEELACGHDEACDRCEMMDGTHSPGSAAFASAAAFACSEPLSDSAAGHCLGNLLEAVSEVAEEEGEEIDEARA